MSEQRIYDRYGQPMLWAHQAEQFAGRPTYREPIPTNIEMAAYSAAARRTEAAQRWAAEFESFLDHLEHDQYDDQPKSAGDRQQYANGK